MVNYYPGLNRGPIDHKSSSVINIISNGAINMGSAVIIIPSPNPSEVLPRGEESSASSTDDKLYGITVGGDSDGIFGDGTAGIAGDGTFATEGAGQGAVVVTQGRCLARVETTVGIAVGDPLGSSGAGAGNEGVLINIANTEAPIIARALASVASSSGFNIIPVDVQRALGSVTNGIEMGYEDDEEMGYEDDEEMGYG